MAPNVPFSCTSLPFPFPRRLAYVVGCIVTLILVLNLLAPSTLPPAISRYPGDIGSKWVPPILAGEDSKLDEWDEDGRCLFLSPYDALSAAEKAAAEQMQLVEVSPGIVQVNNATSSTGVPLSPILALLRDGERKWNNLINSQSRTLEQAVKHYENKWGRPPPKGFDSWWMFAQDHETLLIDEFDAIMESLLPFYGLPIDTLKERAKETEKIPETFTLIVHDGKVEVEWNDDYSRDKWWGSRSRADAQVNLMEPFINMLDSFRATFTVHDQPSILLDYHRKKQLVDAARSHKVSTHPNEADRAEQVWTKACAPDSPLNKGVKEELSAETFVSNHLAAMDICNHPGLMETHGMFLEQKGADSRPKPHTKLYPILVPSKTMLHGDIPVTPVVSDGRRDDIGHDPAWNQKKSKVYWRGHSTGLDHNKGPGAKWRQSHRERLHWLANDKTGKTVEVLYPTSGTGETERKTFSLSSLGAYYMDAKLMGAPLQCDAKDGSCDEMAAEIDFAAEVPWDESNKFKYVLDVDSNAWSSRFTRLMASMNVVIKSTIFPEWNSGHLPEWFAYVPSKVDYSDLYSIIAFFRGSPNGKGSHDEVARRIALNSQCWVERTWRPEDQQVYMYRLYLEYARLMSPNRDNGNMDFVLQDYHRDKVEVDSKQKPGSLKEVEAMPGIDQ